MLLKKYDHVHAGKNIPGRGAMTPALATVERSTKNAAADDDLEQAGLSFNKSTFPQHFVHS